MTFEDRYRAAGLTHNPFVAWQPGDPVLSGFIDRGLPPPPEPGSRTLVQVIGDSGHGKSTQLAHWRSRTPGPLHYIVRTPYRERWTAPPLPHTDGNIVYGDEIDRMPRVRRALWFRLLAGANATVVVGTHTDLAPIARRAGFAVITHRLERADRSLIERVITARLGAASIPGVSTPTFADADIDEVVRSAGGVLREADVRCHQILADLVR